MDLPIIPFALVTQSIIRRESNDVCVALCIIDTAQTRGDIEQVSFGISLFSFCRFLLLFQQGAADVHSEKTMTTVV